MLALLLLEDSEHFSMTKSFCQQLESLFMDLQIPRAVHGPKTKPWSDSCVQFSCLELTTLKNWSRFQRISNSSLNHQFQVAFFKRCSAVSAISENGKKLFWILNSDTICYWIIIPSYSILVCNPKIGDGYHCTTVLHQWAGWLTDWVIVMQCDRLSCIPGLYCWNWEYLVLYLLHARCNRALMNLSRSWTKLYKSGHHGPRKILDDPPWKILIVQIVNIRIEFDHHISSSERYNEVRQDCPW